MPCDDLAAVSVFRTSKLNRVASASSDKSVAAESASCALAFPLALGTAFPPALSRYLLRRERPAVRDCAAAVAVAFALAAAGSRSSRGEMVPATLAISCGVGSSR